MAAPPNGMLIKSLDKSEASEILCPNVMLVEKQGLDNVTLGVFSALLQVLEHNFLQLPIPLTGML